MDEIDAGLTGPEKEEFKNLRTDKSPPARLEYQTVAALTEIGLIRKTRLFRRIGAAYATGLAFGAMLLLGVGIALGMWWQSKNVSAGDSPQFMLVLRSDSHRDLGEMDNSRAVEYGQWARTIGSQGIKISGEKLKNETRTLNIVDGRAATTISSAQEAQNSFGGYFLISARDYQQAAEIASQCPHLKYGGTIEVRQIDK